MATSSVNVEKLRTLAKASDTARIVFSAFAERERATQTTDLRRHRRDLELHGHSINPKDYEKIFLGLQEAGIGRIYYSQKGRANRFKWEYSIMSVGSVALGESNKLHRWQSSTPELPRSKLREIASQAKTAEVKTLPPAKGEANPGVRVSIKMRDGRVVRIDGINDIAGLVQTLIKDSA